VQQFLPNQLHILGFPVSVQLFVLVTSIAPLRAYLYGEGIVSFRHGEENNYRKVKLNFKCITLRPLRRGNRLTLCGSQASLIDRKTGFQKYRRPQRAAGEVNCLSDAATCQWNALLFRTSCLVFGASLQLAVTLVQANVESGSETPRIHNPDA
jgi:hypothetical protein